MKPRDGLAPGLLWISPWILGFLAFMLVPMALSFLSSLSDDPLLEPAVFIGLDNYRELLHDRVAWIAVRNTALYAFLSITLGTVLSLSLAALLEKPGPFVTVVRAIVFLPTVVPLVAVALGWLWLYNSEYGFINVSLQALGAAGVDWTGDRRFALLAIVIIGLWQTGAAVVIYLAALQDVPRVLYEAAAIDGMGPVRRFLSVTMPMISPAILFNVVIGIIWSIQVFAVPHIMTRGGPDHATWFLTTHVYANAFVYGRMGYANAVAWVQLAFVLILTATTLLAARRLVHASVR